MLDFYSPHYFFSGILSAGIKLLFLGGFIAIIIFLITKNKKMEKQTPKNQGGNVLPGPGGSNPQVPPPTKKRKKRYSALSVFMAIILFGILVMLGERLIFDLNRFLNPVIDDDYTKYMNEQRYSGRRSYDRDMPQMKMPVRSYEMSQDMSNVAPKTQIYYNATQKGRYVMYKLIIHAAVIIPVFVLAFVLFYLKRKNYQLRPLLISFLFAAFWLMFHLLGETISFVMNEYRNIAIYVILVILAAVFGILAYYTQVKQHRKEEAKE